MKQFKLLMLLPFYLGCINDQSHQNASSKKLGIDTAADTYSVTADDTSMNSAIKKAKATINNFDLALKSDNSSCSDFAVKKKYNTPDGGGEHMWVAGIILVNGGYKGFINNDAEMTTEVKYGDSVFVRKDEITDWMYIDNNVLQGGYTIREVRNKLTKEEKIKMDKELGFRVEE